MRVIQYVFFCLIFIDLSGYSQEIDSAELMEAVRDGETIKVRLLLEIGGNVNTQDEDGWSLLMMAIYRKHFETAKLLIGYGADINHKNTGGFTPLMISSYSGQTEFVHLLIEAGADVNMHRNGLTALMQAIIWSHPDIVRLFLETDTDINIVTLDECSVPPLDLIIPKDSNALSIAEQMGNDEIIRLLKEASE